MINRYERLNQELKMVETKRKVAAYCRVSTDNEDQANSFESQQRYFRQYIERNPDWELYEIFADEGISGTNTKKRKEFNRMIACAKNGDFDLIITKEISRFARNTLDSIYYTRELKKHGVGVIFMNDNINTLDGDAELRLAIILYCTGRKPQDFRACEVGTKTSDGTGCCVRQKYVGLRCRGRQNDYQRGRRKGCTPYLP